MHFWGMKEEVKLTAEQLDSLDHTKMFWLNVSRSPLAGEFGVVLAGVGCIASWLVASVLVAAWSPQERPLLKL